MKRMLSFLVLGALGALSACSSSPSVAASVNGHDISTSTLTADVAGFARSDAFRSSLAQQGVQLTKNGPVPTSFAAQWLVSRMKNEAIALVAERRHVSATAQEKDAARAQFKASKTSGTAFGQLPTALQQRIVDAAALESALRATLKPLPNGPALQQAYQQIQADCPSKKLVGHILVKTPEEAQQVVDRIKQGATFADVAKQTSTDTGSTAQGGLLLCENSSQWQQLDATFRAGAEATPVGQLSPPIKTRFGYHVIEVLDLTPANAAPLVAATAQIPDPLAPLISEYLKKAKLYVNPRFGKLRRQGGAFTIDPPLPKTTKTRPSTTTAPGVPAAGSGASSGQAPASGSGPTGTSSTSAP